MSFERAVALARRAPHTFTIQYPPSREFFRERYRDGAAPEGTADLTRLLFYLHVPFCEAKCFYCNFAVDLRKQEDVHRRYVDALVAQTHRILDRIPERCSIAGIDIGGGTPTLLAAPLLERVLEAVARVRARADVPHPISIETTPRVAAERPEILAILRAHGVDRISVGLQSTNDETLASVNRRAQRSLADRAAANLVAQGFRRVNVDLVFGLPGQTRDHFREDLDLASRLGVDSITTYDCLYRGEGRALPRLTAERPSADEYGALYDLAHDRLISRGYHAPYGSVNFSRHPGETGTSPYFEGRLLDGLPYLGAGNYASSLIGERWWFAPYKVDAYLEAIDAGDPLPAEDAYRLPLAERMAKSTLLSLNFGFIDPARFFAQFGVDLEARFAAEIDHALAQRWLCRTQAFGREVYGVAPGAFGRMPEIRALFYSAAAVDWLRARML